MIRASGTGVLAVGAASTIAIGTIVLTHPAHAEARATVAALFGAITAIGLSVAGVVMYVGGAVLRRIKGSMIYVHGRPKRAEAAQHDEATADLREELSPSQGAAPAGAPRGTVVAMPNTKIYELGIQEGERRERERHNGRYSPKS